MFYEYCAAFQSQEIFAIELGNRSVKSSESQPPFWRSRSAQNAKKPARIFHAGSSALFSFESYEFGLTKM